MDELKKISKRIFMTVIFTVPIVLFASFLGFRGELVIFLCALTGCILGNLFNSK